MSTILKKVQSAKEYGLTNNDLIIYDSFRQLDMSETKAKVSQRVLAEWCNVDHSTLKRSIRKLKDKGLISSRGNDLCFAVKDIYK